MTKKTKRGGLRNPPGGRPPDPNSKKSFLVKLPPEVIGWLRNRKATDPSFSMGGWIGKTCQAAIDDIDRCPECGFEPKLCSCAIPHGW